ncbi:MAG: hypothetical protein AAB445_03470 [Patescibacteria group bacterium]
MQHPRGIAVILGVVISLGIIAVAVTGVVLIQRKPAAPAATNTNAALNLACTIDADCSSYCGADACFQPICGTTTIGGTGSCTCRSLCGPIVPAANTNTSVNVNASTNANTNTAVDPTAGWKTYTNATQGYSVKYPSDWVTQVIDSETGAENPVGEVTTFWSKADYKKLIPDGTEWMPTDTLYYFRVTYKDASAVANAKDPNTKKLSSTAINVGGVAGVKEVYQGAYGNWTVVYLTKGGLTYGLYLPDKNADQKVLAATILSTFTFLDETAGWKTYTNTQYSFSFRYPSNWSLLKSIFDPTADEGLAQGGDSIAVENSVTGEKFQVCPDKRGPGCTLFQDGEWTSVKKGRSVGNAQANESIYTFTGPGTCSVCTVRSLISLNKIPVIWTRGDFLLVTGTNASFVNVNQILSTFAFTK